MQLKLSLIKLKIINDNNNNVLTKNVFIFFENTICQLFLNISG